MFLPQFSPMEGAATANMHYVHYPFHPVGQFYRVRAGHLWCQMCSSLTNLNLSVSSGSYCTSLIVGSGVYSNTLATLFTHYPTVWKVKCSVVGTRVLAVL